jgi:hypothetical protein
MRLELYPYSTQSAATPSFRVWATVDHVASLGAVATTNIWFGVGAPAERFAIPLPVEPMRTDSLWRTTCFEAFFRSGDQDSYREWNFAPSGQWAAYDFASYRKDIAEAEILSPPYVRIEDNLTWWALGATIAVDANKSWEVGLSAILEHKDGTKSYWALAHPASEKPDFHHPDCFVARLP